MLKKIITTFFVITLSFLANGTPWEEDVNGFVRSRLSDLRASRSLVKREKPGIGLATEILYFIVKGTNKYGVGVVANSDNTAELVVDLSDVINLQTPDFKNRYDIFVEQWVEKGVQRPFSLFTFDRVAQAFKYRDRIFNIDSGSPYSRWIEIIFREEIPSLHRTIRLIRDLEIARGRNTGTPRVHKGYGFFHGRMAEEQRLLVISGHLDKIRCSAGPEKARWERLVRQTISNPSLNRLLILTAMAHDYFVLQRIERAVDIVLKIPSYGSDTERQAFLAGMIQIGELATNKNLSKFIKYHAERAPWDELVHIRDAIEHQDENGFSVFFEEIVDGTNTSFDFMRWRRELEILKDQVKDLRLRVWGVDPKVTYDSWIKRVLTGNPTYGIIQKVEKNPIDTAKRKKFRKTKSFKLNKQLWASVLKAEQPIQYEVVSLISTLRDELGDNNEIESYLYERLIGEAIHLTPEEIDLLIDTVKSNLDKENVVKTCLGLLSRDQDVLDPKNGRAFIKAFTDNGLDFKPYGKIYFRIHPVMPLTRRVVGILRYNSSKDMDQPTRRTFSLEQLRKTQTHLHNMAHGEDIFDLSVANFFTYPSKFFAIKYYGEGSPEASVMSKMLRQWILERFFGEDAVHHEEWGGRTEKETILLGNIMKRIMQERSYYNELMITQEYRDFLKKEVMDMYRIIHRINLPKSIIDKPTAYLASVYTLSVGLGGFKTWLSREPSPSADDVRVFEELREERNFIAHGDILREMHNIDLGKVHIHMLTGYLDVCERVGV